MLTGCADWFEIRYKPALNEEIDALIERENLFRTSGGSRYLVDRVSALRQNDSDRKVFAAILDYLREKVSGKDSYLDQYVKTHAYMYSGTVNTYRLRVRRKNLNDVFDWFGQEITFENITGDAADVLVHSDKSSMQFWLQRYGKNATLIEEE